MIVDVNSHLGFVSCFLLQWTVFRPFIKNASKKAWRISSL